MIMHEFSVLIVLLIQEYGIMKLSHEIVLLG